MNSLTLEEAKKFQSAHLITLSKRIDELFLLIQKGKITSIDFRILTVEANRQSKEKLHIGLFVAAKDGKPLKEPKPNCLPASCVCVDFAICDIADEREELNEEYNKALRDVIFEGWEVSKKIRQYIYLYNPICDIELEFDLIQGVVELNLNHSTLNDLRGDVKNLADLAHSTTENPLKLK